LAAQILPSRYEELGRNPKIYLPRNDLPENTKVLVQKVKILIPSEREIKALNLADRRENFVDTVRRFLQNSSNNQFPNFIDSLCSNTVSLSRNAKTENPNQLIDNKAVDPLIIFPNNEKTNKTIDLLLLPFKKNSADKDLKFASKVLYFMSQVSPKEVFQNRIEDIINALKTSEDKTSQVFLTQLLLNQSRKSNFTEAQAQKVLEILQKKKSLATELSMRLLEQFPQISLNPIKTNEKQFSEFSIKDMINNRAESKQLAQNQLANESLALDTKDSFGIEMECYLQDTKQIHDLIARYNKKLQTINQTETNQLSLGKDTYGIPEIRTGYGGLPLNHENISTISKFLEDLNSSPYFHSLETNQITIDANEDKVSPFQIKEKTGPHEDSKYKLKVLEFNTPPVTHSPALEELPFLINTTKLNDQIILLNSLKNISDKDLNKLNENKKKFLEASIKNYFNANTIQESTLAQENILLSLANLAKHKELYAPILRLGKENSLPPLSASILLNIYTKITDSIEGLNLSKQDLSQISIRVNKIENSDFSETNLEGAKIEANEIHKTSFSGSNLSKAELNSKILNECNFRSTNLDSATIKANLGPYSDFSHSYQKNTKLLFQDSTNIYGLAPRPHKPQKP